MDLQKSCRRLAAWVLTLALAAALALPGGAVYAMPIQTANAQESIYLINAVTGEVLLDQNAGQQRCVASLTKMMTALLLLESGKDLNETITVPASLTEEFQNIRSRRLPPEKSRFSFTGICDMLSLKKLNWGYAHASQHVLPPSGGAGAHIGSGSFGSAASICSIPHARPDCNRD